MAKTKNEKLKKIFASIAIILCTIGIILVIKSVTMGTQNISVTTANNYYKDSSLYAIVDVKDYESGISIASKVTAEVIDSKGFSVKGTKKSYSKEENNKVSIDLPLNEVKDNEKYYLKITSNKGLMSDSRKYALNIIASSSKNSIISLDKGIYKPNDTINYRLLLLDNENNKPIEDEVSVSIFDGNDNRVYLAQTKTSSFGIVSGSFTLGEDLNSGTYRIQVNSRGYSNSKSFKVNPYIVPQFEVNINSDKDSYILGNTAHIVVNAKYFFGEPTKNANVAVSVNGEHFEGLTDNEGNYAFDYEVKEENPIQISAEVQDESHAYVENSKTLIASKNVFNVELVPEYGSLISGVSNRLYLLTTKPDGSALKTRTTIKLGTLEKQIITDESGVGYIDLVANDISDLVKSNSSNISTVLKCKITSEDYEGNKVTIDTQVDCDTSSKFALKTDKIKYNQNDDIILSMDNAVDTTYKTIMVCKGENILKLYSTDENQATINLDGAFGLIDIFVSKTNMDYVRPNPRKYIVYDGIYNSSYGKNYTKKTIFVIPNNSLTVDVSTDKETYNPGDTLNLSISTKNSSQNVEAAALVSILDNAVLALADNDLSIDNVKLALEDIELSDDITAADLYAMVMEDKDPAKLEALLIKQSSDKVNLTNTNPYREEGLDKDGFLGIGIIGIELGVLVLCYVFLFKKNTHPIQLAVSTLLVFNILFAATYSNNILLSIIASAIITIIIYKLLLEKYSEIIVEFGLYYLVLNSLVYNLAEYELDDPWDLLIYFIPIAIALAIKAFINSKKPKNRAIRHLFNIAYNLGCATITLFIASRIEESYIISYGFADILSIVAFIGLFIFKRKVLDKSFKEFYEGKQKVEKKANNKGGINIQVSIDGKTIVGIIIIVVLIIMLILSRVNTFSRPVSNYDDVISTNSRRGMDWGSTDLDIQTFSGTSTSEDSFSLNQFSSKGDSSGASAASSNIFDGIGGLLGTQSNANKSAAQEIQEVEEMEAPTSTSTAETSKTEKTEKIRNVFLESLAFLPEVIVNNGNTQEQVPISDNITTWNIQVVANTKEGNLGFGSKEFKVFKDFFVNFELPKNSVVTDKVSLPVTIYNYSTQDLTVDIDVEQAEWFTLYENISRTNFVVNSGSTQVIYVPIEILKAGNNKLKITAKANGVQDIIEKSFEVKPNGYNVQKVVSSGKINEDYSTDYFTTDNILEGTHNVKVKIYPNMISQQIENIDSILRMPTGCFEQTSSSLYPDALVLEYLKNSKVSDQSVEKKALEYVNKGYQRLLTFEVSSKPGGFSLYGRSPAELALTAYGYMELNDISKVYDIDQNVLKRMHDYIYSEQNVNGSFNVNSNSYFGSHLANNDLALNAYVAWCLSEVDPKEPKLSKTINYLESKLSKSEDTYTVALMANAFANVGSSKAKNAIDILIEKTSQGQDGSAYVVSNIRDYYGCYGRWQNVQTTALASLALTHTNTNSKTNDAYLKYLVSAKDKNGTWGNTQATVLSLKALNAEGSDNKVQSQTIKVSYAGQTKEIKLNENELVNQIVTFENVPLEGKFNIDIEKGKIYYEIVADYYTPYDFETKQNKGFTVSQNLTADNNYIVNSKVTQHINVVNSGDNDVENGLVKINIPQGMTVLEDSLAKLVSDGKIQKYDYNYNTLNLYLRNTPKSNALSLDVQYRILYKERVTGGMVQVFDYYNPEYLGTAEPVLIETDF